MADNGIRYFITRGDEPEREVTKEEFVDAERRAGFYNTLGQRDEPATAVFSSDSSDEKIAGRISYP